jgi:hypothetical protein
LVGGTYPVQAWKNGTQRTLVDNGWERKDLTLRGDLVYNYEDRSMEFNGFTFATADTVSAAIQVGPFTVVTTVEPFTEATHHTVWEFGTASTETLSLQIDGRRFALRYGARQSTIYLSPNPWIATHSVVVRCNRGRTLCTLTSY